MRAVLTVLILLAACRGSDKDATPAGTGVPTGGTSSLADDLDVVCAQQLGNVLRFDCTVTTNPPAPLTFTLQEQGVDGAPDGPVRTLDFPDTAPEHRFTLSGLVADTTYAWTADNTDLFTLGELTVGPAPSGFPDIEADGDATFAYVLFAIGTRLFVVDPAGRIVWYEDAVPVGDEPMNGVISGYDWTGDGVVFHITSTLRHVGLAGDVRLALDQGTDFDRPLHADVHWDDGRIWALNAGAYQGPNGSFVSDGFYGFDETGVFASWNLADHLESEPAADPEPTVLWAGVFPGHADIGQANSIQVTDAGALLLSFRKLSSVWALGGPDDPDFGQVRWRMNGQGGGDFALSVNDGVTLTADFLGQNHARLQGTRLSLFDNRTGADARGLVYEVDANAGTAAVVVSHQMGRPCDLLGSTYELANGNLLTTCASSFEVMEFAAGTPEDVDPDWILTVQTNQPWMARGIPIAEVPAGW